MADFGQRLHMARRARKMTQGALAKAVKLNHNTISRAERSAEATLSGSTIAGIAQVLGVTTDYLLGLAEDERHAYAARDEVAV